MSRGEYTTSTKESGPLAAENIEGGKRNVRYSPITPDFSRLPPRIICPPVWMCTPSLLFVFGIPREPMEGILHAQWDIHISLHQAFKRQARFSFEN